MPIADTNCCNVLKTSTATSVTVVTNITTVYMSNVFPYCSTTVEDHYRQVCSCVVSQRCLDPKGWRQTNVGFMVKIFNKTLSFMLL